jgi:hypothetical protein
MWMKLEWQDGYSREYEVGANLRGFKHENLRPVTVSFTKGELPYLYSEWGRNWVEQVLFPCLGASNA